MYLIVNKVSSIILATFVQQPSFSWIKTFFTCSCNNVRCKNSTKHCVFRMKFFRSTAEVERITFLVSFIRLQKAGVYVLIV
jgi:hypothetical protein